MVKSTLVSIRRRHGQIAMKSTARLRARVLALLDAAQQYSGQSQVDIAETLGIRKSAVHQVLKGNGNLRIDTLGEYLSAMGMEADIVVAKSGEFSLARRERRRPDLLILTMADSDREANGVHFAIVEVKVANTNKMPINKAVLGVTAAMGATSRWS